MEASLVYKVSSRTVRAIQRYPCSPVSYTHLEPTRLALISYAVFCLKKKKKKELQVEWVVEGRAGGNGGMSSD